MTNLAKATASSTQTADVSLANLPSLTHNTVPVLTTELLAKLYGTDAVRIRQGYSRNVSRFIEGKHFTN
ncbi:ORF6N domain-containing protein [Sodalis ligni]|uniref:ORF6N domain-containing protein n=1 Tax=Sodalis ligni TaxID=2697027 RepID=UPI003B84A952